MFGAICGDVLGSTYEWHNIKYCPTTEELLSSASFFTDDSVMTIAVALGIADIINALPKNWLNDDRCKQNVMELIKQRMVEFGRAYLRAGYGERFVFWLFNKNRKPYNSWGNGSAMRVSAAGWAGRTLEETLAFAECSAAVTHNHPEGIKGAKVVAGIIFLLRQGATKEKIEKFASEYYNMGFTLDEIRPTYTFDVSCQGSVPQAIRAFLEGNNFLEVISLAISIGGDSDTIAAIAGSMAEVIYPIPETIQEFVRNKLDDRLLSGMDDSIRIISSRIN